MIAVVFVVVLLQPRSFTMDVTEGCGKTKGCYRNPPECSEEACDIVVTWKRRNDYLCDFELSADTDGWVALGLSDDKKMVCQYCYLLTYFLGSTVLSLCLSVSVAQMKGLKQRYEVQEAELVLV